MNTRRSALQALSALASGIATWLGGGRHAKADEHAPANGIKLKRRWGMAIDLDRCTACSACVVACRQENNIPTVESKYDTHGAQIEWMSALWRDPSEGKGGLPEMLPFPCQHCLNAQCVKVCPVGATYKDDEGLTVQVWDRCIGCRYCMVACPYGRRSYNWAEPEWDGTLVQLLNPDVATRPRGVVEKCTFCSHRIADVKERAKLEGRAPMDEELRRLTACAAACPSEAISFGDLNDPDSTVARQARSPRVFRLLEDLDTEPSVVYLQRDRRT
jgi:menaquinone reductase, iron-sulfur cluster-binding subunit